MPHTIGLGTPINQSPKRDEDAVSRIEQKLPDEILAEARSGVVHSRGSPLHVRSAEQSDCPVAQFLSLQQDEEDEENDDARSG
jgi:hypothetical protein